MNNTCYLHRKKEAIDQKKAACHFGRPFPFCETVGLEWDTFTDLETMSRQNLWTDEEVMLALLLYLSRPFGQLRSTHPDVVRLASQLGRTPDAVSRKIGNLDFCDDSL